MIGAALTNVLADTVPTIGTNESAVELNRCKLPTEDVPSAGMSAQYIVTEGDGVRLVMEAVLVALLLVLVMASVWLPGKLADSESN